MWCTPASHYWTEPTSETFSPRSQVTDSRWLPADLMSPHQRIPGIQNLGEEEPKSVSTSAA